MNLYIIDEVLSDYWPGMVVIKAKTLEDCREIFAERFAGESFYEEMYMKEFDKAIGDGEYKVLKLSRDDKMPVGVVAVKWGGS